jgi:hypothetical protein
MQFFSEEVATAMEHYNRVGIRGMEDCEGTVKFIRRMNVLIDAMNANTRRNSLKSPENEEVMEHPNPVVCSECNVLHAENTPQNKQTSRKVRLSHFMGIFHFAKRYC